MAASGPGWEGIDVAWEALQDEVREAQQRALEGDHP
jgi:hypothetical protein